MFFRLVCFHVFIFSFLAKLHVCVYQSVNQSIKSSICKAPLKQSSQRRLLWVGLHKEPNLKARLELFATNITVLEMRWQHVPNLRCRDAETARTITRGPSTLRNHVIVVCRTKPRTKGNRDDRWTDVVRRLYYLSIQLLAACAFLILKSSVQVQ